MTIIGEQEKLITLINVFTVLPEQQQSLIDALNNASHEILINIPGFISATIHRSLDGTRVTNYAQWKSVEDVQRMLHNPVVTPHLQAIKKLAEKVEPMLYEVVHSTEKRERNNTYTEQEIASCIYALISEHTGLDIKLTPDTRLEAELEIDSLERVEIGIKLEKAFLLQISDSDLRQCTTLRDLIHFTYQKISQNDHPIVNSKDVSEKTC